MTGNITRKVQESGNEYPGFCESCEPAMRERCPGITSCQRCKVYVCPATLNGQQICRKCENDEADKAESEALQKQDIIDGEELEERIPGIDLTPERESEELAEMKTEWTRVAMTIRECVDGLKCLTTLKMSEQAKAYREGLIMGLKISLALIEED